MVSIVTESGSVNGGPSDWLYDSKVGDDGKYNSDGSIKRNPYSRFKRKLHYTSYFGVWSARLDDLQAQPVRDQNLYLKTLSDLSELARGHSIALGNDLATIGQTVNLVGDTLTRFVTSYKYLKHGNIRSALRALGSSPRESRHQSTGNPAKPLGADEASALWLEIQYGWKPLLSDVYQVASAMEHLNNPPVQYTVQTSRHKYHGEEDFWIGEFPYRVHNISHSDEYYQIVARGVEILSAPRTLGLQDPLSIAWEVMPWSFAIDWFIPIGSYLDNLNQIPNISATFEIRHRHADKLTSGFGGYLDPKYGDGLYYEDIFYSRTYSTTLDVPLPHFKSLPQAFSPAHIWNAIALATQTFHK